MSIPAVVGQQGVETVLDMPLSEEELQKLHRSAETLRGVIDTLEL